MNGVCTSLDDTDFLRRFAQELQGVKEVLTKDGVVTSPLAWRELLGPFGAAGLDLPRRVGGRNLSATSMAELFSTFGYIALDLRDVPGAGHARLVSLASGRQHDEFLRRVAVGEAYAAITITEPNTGSDLHAIETTATPTATGYTLSGTKRFVARLRQATHLIVFARVPRPAMEDRLSVFLVPANSPGVLIGDLQSSGLNGVSFGQVTFDSVEIGRETRVGGEGEGLTLFLRHFSYWRAAMAAAAIGCARAAIDQTISWLRDRNAFGGPIGRFTHLQQGLAKHTARLHASWLLVQSVMARLDQRSVAFADAAMAKAEAVEWALHAVEWAALVHGARGYCSATDIEQRLRDLLGLRIADGTTDVLRGQVARAVLGNDMYELSLGRKVDEQEMQKWKMSRRFW